MKKLKDLECICGKNSCSDKTLKISTIRKNAIEILKSFDDWKGIRKLTMSKDSEKAISDFIEWWADIKENELQEKIYPDKELPSAWGLQ